MKKAALHLPGAAVDKLRETAARLGGMPLDDLLTAAVWIFARQDASVRNWIVREYLFNGCDESAEKKKRKSLRDRLHELGRAFHANVRRWFAG